MMFNATNTVENRFGRGILVILVLNYHIQVQNISNLQFAFNAMTALEHTEPKERKVSLQNCFHFNTLLIY